MESEAPAFECRHTREDRRRLGGEVREERMAGGLLVVDADRQAGKPEEGGDLLCCWRIEGFI